MDFNAADLFERVAGHLPEREAVVCGQARASFGELDRRSNQVARYLLSLGIGTGDHVGIYAYNRIEWVEAMLACYKIRAVPINVNYRYVEEELLYLLDDADFKAIFFEAEFSDRLGAIKSRLPLLAHYICFDPLPSGQDSLVDALDYQASVNGQSAAALQLERSGDDLYVIYTGGTTGMPKGVIWRQEDVVMALGGGIDATTQEKYDSPEAFADNCMREGAFAARNLQLAPLMHGAAQWGMLRGFFEGHTIIISDQRNFDAQWVWRTVEAEQANLMLMTGDAMARPLLDALEQGNYDLSSLFVLVSSAAVFSPALKSRFAEHFPNAIIVDSVGSSEGGFSGATVHDDSANVLDAGGPRMIVGRDTLVLDSDYNILPAKSGKTGLLARGGNIPQGYYKDVEKTAAAFVTAADGKRYAVPGDMARLNEDGTVTLLGRGANCINSGGEKIYPEEVEAAIKSHPEAYDALVVGTPDERFGARVTALVQLREGAETPSLEALQVACERRIARYKLPRTVFYVAEVKRSPSGKPDYQWARQEALSRLAE
jgi:acyl-CoA synthetase (AMP-forming)/AMP-acid ligase II